MKRVCAKSRLPAVFVVGLGLTGCSPDMLDAYRESNAGGTLKPVTQTAAVNRTSGQGWTTTVQHASTESGAGDRRRNASAKGYMGLGQTVEMALARHPDIGRAAAEIDRSGGEVTVAESAWYPKVNYTSSTGAGSGSSNGVSGGGRERISAGLEANQLVFDFGRANGQIMASHAVHEQREAELHDTRERVAMTTSEAYLELSRAHRLVEANDHYLTALVNLRTTISLRANSGAANQADVFVAETRVQSATADRIKSRTRELAAQAKLHQIIGERLTRVDDPKRDIARISTAIKAASADTGTGVMAADRAAAAARARVTVAEAADFPTIGIKASHSMPIMDDTMESTSLVSLSIQGDLLSGGANAGRLSAAIAEAQSAERATELARLTSSTEVDVAAAEIDGARQRTQAYVRQMEMAQKARTVSLEEYNIGKRTLTEVLNTEQDIFRAETDQINADGDAQSAVLRAASARGVLVASLLQ